jgi:hypothetical protein
MKIGIIGAGWFGCHIAFKLKQSKHEIDLFEKAKDIFSNTSGNNQNRLHAGYHYPRSKKTIKVSKLGFKKFKKEYGFLTKKIINNIYTISDTKQSKMNWKKYFKIIKDSKLNYKIIKKNDKLIESFENLQQSLKCQEELILKSKAISFFKKKLNSSIKLNTTIKNIEKKNNKFFVNGKQYDYLINCSGLQFENENYKMIKNLEYEYCVIFLYKKKDTKPHPGLTIMDGPFFTLYPSDEDNNFGLYSVKNSRLLINNSFKNLKKNVEKKLNISHLKIVKKKVENEFKFYYPEFKKKFKFVKFLTSYRALIKSKDDERICHVYNQDKLISVVPSKIDHIFDAYDKVEKCLKKY